MLTAEDHVIDGDVEHPNANSRNTAGDHEESEKDEEKEKSEVDDAVWKKDAVAASTTTPTTPEKPGLLSLQDTSDTDSSASVSSSSPSPSMTRSNSLVEISPTPTPLAEGIINEAGKIFPVSLVELSRTPTPLAEEIKINEGGENLPLSEGEHFDACFDACSVMEKALRLGLVIFPTDYAGENEAETRLIGILQAHRLHREKYVESLVLADLLSITPRHSAGHRHATHQRRLEIFMAWQYPCESVCGCGRFHCMDSKKLLEFYRNQHNDQPNLQLCDELMVVRDGEPSLLVLSKANLSTGTPALEKGIGGGDLDDIGSLPDDSMKSKETVPPIASGSGNKDDPFAPREGKTLVWTGVSMTLVCKNKLCSFLFGCSARICT
jgi:hypothetical protein